jgi:RNA polymerase sigma-70 factor (ECF subfamily)
MPAPGGNVTLLLTELREGNQEAADQLMPLIYGELRRMAGSYMQRERAGHTLQATALVNEVYMRLVGGDPTPWQNRAHFFGVAAHAMREVLLDHARRHIAAKRGGKDAHKVGIDVELRGVLPKIENVIAIDEALERLAQIDPLKAV